MKDMSKKKNKPKSNVDIIKGIRGTWGAISPVTKVIPDKRNRKPKHKNAAYEE